MSIEEMLELFDIIQDKKNEPYFEIEEKIICLNASQILFISEFIENNFQGGLGARERGFIADRGIENTIAGSDIIKPLICNLSFLNGSGSKLKTSAVGKLSNIDIESSINFHSGVDSRVFKLLSLAVNQSGKTKMARYVRHNDLQKFLENDFLTPSINNPLYVVDQESYQFYPKQEMEVEASVIRYPVDMVYISDNNEGNVDCELDESYQMRIISRAIDIASVSTRDGNLISMNNLLNSHDRNKK